MAEATASQRLRTSMRLLVPALSRIGERFWQAPHLDVLYPRYLVTLHTIVRASVPLMEDALRVVRERHHAEPVGPPLAAYLTRHIPEERSHDDWLLEDLERIGHSRQVALEHPPSPTVAAMVGAQYYYIRHRHPVVLLGYIAALEGYPPAEHVATTAAERTGYPVTAFRTLRKHAHLDPHHSRDVDHAVDEIVTGTQWEGPVRANALQTLAYVQQLFQQVVAEDLSSQLTSETAPA